MSENRGVYRDGMGDSNVGLGMVPHKSSCRCLECENDRNRKRLADLEHQLAEAEERNAELERYLSGVAQAIKPWAPKSAKAINSAIGKAEPAGGGEMNTVCPVCGGSGKDDKCNMPPMCLADDLRIADLEALKTQYQEEAIILRGRLAEHEDTMHRIRSWCNAYPLQVFPVPDFALAAKVLKEAGLTLDAVSASNMRHVLKGVQEIIDAAIGKAAKDGADRDIDAAIGKKAAAD